uniref:G-patch domain-containing protein n=1 Tax=Meloidogyne incognita TaxID=6306 RepID=A0A914M9I5_MELIC
MSMLAEPRRKQRISVDPQNLNWVNNEKNFGKKLMKQMGWKGGGLGPEGVGIKDCVKTRANNDQRGLGSTKDYCVPHLDEYARILEDLNKAKENKKENTSEQIKKRKKEEKFQNNFEEKTKTRSKRIKKEEERKNEENCMDLQINNLTMDQYFAQKMAKIRKMPT